MDEGEIAMKAKMEKLEDDVVVVALSGRVEIENAEPFYHACVQSFSKFSENVIFNMEKLSFVGSNGITPFVKAIVELSRAKEDQLKFCKVSSEFKKIFAASPLQEVEIFETQQDALDAVAKVEELVQENDLSYFPKS